MPRPEETKLIIANAAGHPPHVAERRRGRLPQIDPRRIQIASTAGGGNFEINPDYAATPCPTTAALIGLGGISVMGRRRRKSAGSGFGRVSLRRLIGA